MDGRPLYEYARSGDPLPRPIEKRTVTVHSLKLTHWIPGSEHSFNYPEKKFTDEEREKMERALRGKQIPEDAQIKDEPETSISDRADVSTEVESEGKTLRPPAFVLSMQVSGGLTLGASHMILDMHLVLQHMLLPLHVPNKVVSSFLQR